MLKELADQQRTTGKTVVVRGHDDGAGTPQQQLALSQRRAAAIEAELVRLGVPAQMVRVEAMGNQENVGATTPTGNRRVEILFE
jgi:outer membrane protein OmpA-like peptidoglycan-associated protein